MAYHLTHPQYTRLLRYFAQVSEEYKNEHMHRLFIELTLVPHDYENGTFEIPDKLMVAIAIANLCDMAITQYQDSNGEIDYASLGKCSLDVLHRILENINKFARTLQ